MRMSHRNFKTHVMTQHIQQVRANRLTAGHYSSRTEPYAEHFLIGGVRSLCTRSSCMIA